MIARIKCWSSKLLSYSGRLQLVKSMLFQMHTYWSQIFLLPKKIITTVTTVSRTFLWKGAMTSQKRPWLHGRQTVSQSSRGLNVIDILTWNNAAICKLL
uniref:Putative ovule protein n=1 Tax=Solanum chacoense TaxID=4108 RepID=A0A0V0HDW4_SOLCH